jgi:hypothetical protein
MHVLSHNACSFTQVQFWVQQLNNMCRWWPLNWQTKKKDTIDRGMHHPPLLFNITILLMFVWPKMFLECSICPIFQCRFHVQYLCNVSACDYWNQREDELETEWKSVHQLMILLIRIVLVVLRNQGHTLISVSLRVLSQNADYDW